MKHKYHKRSSGPINYYRLRVGAVMLAILHGFVIGMFYLMDSIDLLKSALSEPWRVYLAEGIVWVMAAISAYSFDKTVNKNSPKD